MGHQITANLMRSVRESIERLNAATSAGSEDRAVMRALAHLWSAYDELEMMARTSLEPAQLPANDLRPA